jgi:hypothetical protein
VLHRTSLIALLVTLVVALPTVASAQPGAEEQWIIYELNRVRWDPASYGLPLGPRPPLAVNDRLSSSARTTANLMATGSCTEHVCNGTWPNRRARNAFYPLPAYWEDNANYIESTYVGTNPISGLLNSGGHTTHVLGGSAFYVEHREIGVGNDGSHWAFHTAYDDHVDNRLFITGVAYADSNDNGRMDLGEGQTNITISVPGHGTTTTNPGGGYAIRVSPGTHTITAQGPGFDNQSVTIAVVAHNVGIDFVSGKPRIIRQYDNGPQAPSVAMFDSAEGRWHMRNSSGVPFSFYFGNPGDYPFMGDWTCDGSKTPGLYRQSDGFVYLRASNTQGIADITFFFGNPGDIPIAGDFNGNGCDTVSIYRPSEGRFYIINKLGTNNGGLGAASTSYLFGNIGDKPFVGDFNGNGIDTVGLHRESTGFVYYRNSHTGGNADGQLFFGDPGDRVFAGDWTGDGTDTVALFRPASAMLYFRFTNTQGAADARTAWGQPHWIPLYRLPLGG